MDDAIAIVIVRFLLYVLLNYLSNRGVPGISDISACLNFIFVMAGYDKIIGVFSILLTVLMSKLMVDPTCNQFPSSSLFNQLDLVKYFLLIFFLFLWLFSGLLSVWERISRKNGAISVLACLFVFYCFFFGSPLLSSDWLDHYSQLSTIIGQSSKNLSPFEMIRALTRSDWFLQSGVGIGEMYFKQFVNARVEEIILGRSPLEIWLNSCLNFYAYLLSASMQAPNYSIKDYMNAIPACVELFTAMTCVLRLICTFAFLSGFVEHLKLATKSTKVAEEKYTKSDNISKYDTAASTPSALPPGAKKTKARSRSKSSGRR